MPRLLQETCMSLQEEGLRQSSCASRGTEVAAAASSLAPTVEIIPGRLFWGPEDTSGEQDRLWALDLCRHGASDGGTYQIKHYLKSSWGVAFGPLGVDSMLRFCRGLEARLQTAKVLVLSTPKGDKGYRANAAVLLGAYLVLRHGWSSEEITNSLGAAEAGLMFPCSWSVVDCPDKRVMSVRDCWMGVELAAKHGWIDPACALEEIKMSKACNMYDSQVTRFDTAWIIPGLLMVGADPVTVILDPNPATCCHLFPAASASTKEPAAEPVSPISPIDSVASTAAGGYESEASSASGPQMGVDARALDFASFFRESGIGLVVRANPEGEPGLPGGKSYGGQAFLPYGLRQGKVEFEDQKIPMPKTVARLLKVCEDFMHGQHGDGVMIHCRAGFGRSVTLACCLAMARLDVPGRALLGWVRIARPGAINSRMQETFLMHLKGRSDLVSYATPRRPLAKGQSCNVGCQVQ